MRSIAILFAVSNIPIDSDFKTEANPKKKKLSPACAAFEPKTVKLEVFIAKES